MKSNRLSAMLFMAAILALGLGLGQTFSVAAAPVAQPSLAPTAYSFQVGAGQTYTGVVRGYCLDFGKTFPTGSLNIKTGQDTKLGAALAYAVDKGYADSNYQQTGLAMWYLSDNTWHDSVISATDHTIAQEIVNAVSTTVPATSTGAISLLDATANNQVQARIQDFRALDGLSSSNYYGEGTLVVTNSGSSPISLYIPYGTIAPAASPDMQNMLLYAAGPDASPTPMPTATAAATETPMPQPTATSETMATDTPTASTSDTSGTLPTTGTGGNLTIALALFALSLVLLVGGYALRKAQPQR